MDRVELFKQILATYEGHGWKISRALLKPGTRDELSEHANELLPHALIDCDFDALWFARPSHAGREAWELRLLTAQPYALFEAFEADEAEADREEARREMENRMREHAAQGESQKVSA
jgi:hypothetical protein